MNLMNRLGSIVLSLFLVATSMKPERVSAAPGDLDSTFGTRGKVTTDFAGNIDVANAAAVQSDRNGGTTCHIAVDA